MKNIKSFALCMMMLVSCVFTSASAQDLPHFGIRLGLDLDFPTSYKYKNGTTANLFGTGAGFDITGVYHMPLGYNFYFEPGASIYYNTLDIDVDTYKGIFEQEFIPLPNGTYKNNMSMRLYGIRIPILVGYSLPLDNIRINFFAGPVLQIGLVARYHVGFRYGEVNFGGSNNAYGDEGLMDRFDAGIRIGGGIEYNKFLFQLYGTIGTCDQASERHVKMRTSQLNIGIGYNF